MNQKRPQYNTDTFFSGVIKYNTLPEILFYLIKSNSDCRSSKNTAGHKSGLKRRVGYRVSNPIPKKLPCKKNTDQN